VNELTDRQNEVLGILVGIYTRNGKPVGSQRIAEGERMGLSSATIRNVMHSLEECGLIEQPHLSAGRIPTDRGYRYYVDHLMKETSVPPHVASMVAREYRSRGDNLENLVEKTSEILSELSVQAGFVVFPHFESLAFNRIQLAPLSSKRILVVWIAGNGFVENHTVELEESMPDEELNRISVFLNREFQGLYLDELKHHLDEKVRTAVGPSLSLYQRALGIVSKGFPALAARRISIKGSHHLLDQPEFLDSERSHRLFRVLKTPDSLLRLLGCTVDTEGVHVHIGVENQDDDVCDCSLVAASYHVRDRYVGNLGILGPKRMRYDQAVSLVDYVSRRFGEALEHGIE